MQFHINTFLTLPFDPTLDDSTSQYSPISCQHLLLRVAVVTLDQKSWETMADRRLLIRPVSDDLLTKVIGMIYNLHCRSVELVITCKLVILCKIMFVFMPCSLNSQLVSILWISDDEVHITQVPLIYKIQIKIYQHDSMFIFFNSLYSTIMLP